MDPATAVKGAVRPGREGRPLLIVCALGIERLALRGGDRSGAAGPVALLRTGMGARAAERAVARALRGDPRLREAAVLATGFCAGLAPALRPGDVVLDERGPARETLVDALTLLGRRVHTGPIAHSDHVVRGAERFRLRAAGAVAVDMETAAVRRAALADGPRPVAAVRVVVDTPEYELLRVATLRTGITAFRVLRSVLPAFLEWHRSIALPWR
ncbi:1-hydroxy-2-methyl-2-butenyl 4-diphosphate reductase [Streptomyces sp. RB6PN25]|uniref:1-hydroxy-2-methyl-2-butenyl 4-diphosphate reductase n=1 Tax=Streptomyces humicola TaxID=2953240 RepID=A0ABT1PZ71_9ACTN|nr:1-hydroxy-2-methyl-2-butenyl 4-diphosphate reductase [Streptomyces humicola]MCQ4082418.1 1-hydroxy-2-methyl-2-butenyl 4-diphosphate reductase [Streptomyces humicola]